MVWFAAWLVHRELTRREECVRIARKPEPATAPWKGRAKSIMKTATEQPQEAVKKTVKPAAPTKPGSKSKKARVKGPSIQNRNAAGIDIGSQSHHVAVPADRDVQPVRTFRAYTCGLEEMMQWLKACRITTVAMESTGVYWIPAYQMLEQNGFEVLLVDARSVKHVPGHKTDVKDCQWLQQLHTYGLLRGAFRPSDETCRLRTLQRHRKNLVESVSMKVQHIQKAFNEMGLHLHHVLSDIMGESGLRIIDAILAGERDAGHLASLVDWRVKKSQAEIAAALKGNYREEQLFVIAQTLESVRAEQRQIEACDQQILRSLQKMSGPVRAESSTGLTGLTPAEELAAEVRQPEQVPAARRLRKKPAKTRYEDSLKEQLKRILGVDLTQIPGLGVLAVLTLLSEIGTNMGKWRNAKAFASWMGLCPNNKISGGRVMSSRTRKVVCRSATILRMAAMAVGRTQTPLGAFYRRKQAHLGAPKAITATARKIACLIYQLLKKQQEYEAKDVRIYQINYRKRAIEILRKRAADLDCDIVEIQKAA